MTRVGSRENEKSRGAFERHLPIEAALSAEAASCIYRDDSKPGIRRLGSPHRFRYVTPSGRPVRDYATLERIRHLAIPPAWTEVWISPAPNGHIQATGRDARGRKQYRYHPRFREIRDETKFERMLVFAEALPTIRKRVDEHLSMHGLSRERVLATVVRLLEITLIRVGNEEYARENGSFGLTTLRTRHVDIHGSTVDFHFRGKSGITHRIKATDRRLAKVVARCHDLPGEILFQFEDESGQRVSIEAHHVNEYLRAISTANITAKDFRTWAGTVHAAEELLALTPPSKKNILVAVKRVSARLGNTPAVCRKSYVHPEIFAAYLEGALDAPPRGPHPTHSSMEAAVMALLRARIAARAEEKTCAA